MYHEGRRLGRCGDPAGKMGYKPTEDDDLGFDELSFTYGTSRDLGVVVRVPKKLTPTSCL